MCEKMDTKNMKEFTYSCLLCPKKYNEPERVTNIFQDVGFTRLLSEFLRVTVMPDPGCPSSACYNCIFTLNHFSEFRRKARKQIEAYKKTYLECQHDVKPFINNIKNQEVNLSGWVISEVRGQVPIYTIDDCDQNDNSFNESSRLLEPMFEDEEECVLRTESGGDIAIKVDDVGYYQCEYCRKEYKTAKYYKRHVQKHQREEKKRRQKAATSTIASRKTEYKCSECGEIYRTKGKYRKHYMKNHSAREKCPHCNNEFMAGDDFGFHKAVCFGKYQGKNNIVHKRRWTRSVANHLDDSETVFSHFTNSAKSDISKYNYVKRWVDERPDIVDDTAEEFLEENLNDNDDRLSVYSTFTSVSMRQPNRNAVSSDEDDEDDEDSLGKPSKSIISIRSKYGKRKKSIQSLIQHRNYLTRRSRTRSASRRISQIDLELNNSEDDDTARRRDHKILEQVIHRRRQKVKSMKRFGGQANFVCEHCGDSRETIEELMRHEIAEHKQMLLYTCNECKAKFTKEKYYNQHIQQHQTGPYQCFLCGNFIDGWHEWQDHLGQHKFNSYNCRYCDRSFLNDTERREHIETKHYEIEGRINCRRRRTKSIVMERFQKNPTSLVVHESRPDNNNFKAVDRIQKTIFSLRRYSTHAKYNFRLGGDVSYSSWLKNGQNESERENEDAEKDEEKDEFIRFSSDSNSDDDVVNSEIGILTRDDEKDKENDENDPFLEMDYVIDDYEDFNPDEYDREERSLDYFQIFSTDILNDSTNTPSSSCPSPDDDYGDIIDVDSYKNCNKKKKNTLNLKKSSHFHRYTVKNQEFRPTDSVIPSYDYILSKRRSKRRRMLLRFDPTRPFRRN